MLSHYILFLDNAIELLYFIALWIAYDNNFLKLNLNFFSFFSYANLVFKNSDILCLHICPTLGRGDVILLRTGLSYLICNFLLKYRFV